MLTCSVPCCANQNSVDLVVAEKQQKRQGYFAGPFNKFSAKRALSFYAKSTPDALWLSRALGFRDKGFMDASENLIGKTIEFMSIQVLLSARSARRPQHL